MSNLDFKQYVKTRNYDEILEAKQHLANYLIESNIDFDQFNKGLSLLEWDYNPFRSFAQGGGAGAGAVAGSAFGPLGAIAGGLAGGAVGRGASNLAGNVFNGVTVKSIEPIYNKAVKAVDALANALTDPSVSSNSTAKDLTGMVHTMQNFMVKRMSPVVSSFDSDQNYDLDSKLNAGGGLSGSLKKSNSSIMKWIGKKIENTPILNQDKGLRRAMAKGMDAVQLWAKNNPKKAGLLNLGAGISGALAGGMATAGNGSGPNDNSSGNSPNNSPNNHDRLNVQNNPIDNVDGPGSGNGPDGNGFTNHGKRVLAPDPRDAAIPTQSDEFIPSYPEKDPNPVFSNLPNDRNHDGFEDGETYRKMYRRSK